MIWPSIRNFLQIPHHLTGKGVGIAVVDGRFPNHPDITVTSRRNTYLVNTSEPDPVPSLMTADDGPWTKGRHGLAAAAAAAGSGLISQGLYTGAAPDADLYLLETGRLGTDQDVECKIAAALDWLYRVAGLFSDSDLDIRYCAIKLAGNIRDEAFVKPLLSGIEDDAIHERVSIFAARCSALEAITGIQFEPEPRWLEEQGIYSERSTRGRVHIARKWGQWASFLSP